MSRPLLKQITRVLSERHQGDAAELASGYAWRSIPISAMPSSSLSRCASASARWPVISAAGAARSPNSIVRKIHPLSLAAYSDDPLFPAGFSSPLFPSHSLTTVPPQFASDRRNAPIELDSRRLRIGYLSSDLRDHAIGYLMAELFEVHDRSRIEVFAYYCGPEIKQRTYRVSAERSNIGRRSTGHER